MCRLRRTRCHGEAVRVQGPSVLRDCRPAAFKTFGERFAATLHRGAPKKWFRAVSEGSGDEVEHLEVPTTVMPAFSDKFTREQIRLVMSNAQGLDIHASASSELGHTR